MVPKKRKRFTSEEKVIILKKHILEKKPLSDLCDDNHISLTMFHKWQNELFCHALDTFDKGKDKECKKWQKEIIALEAKLVKKNEVLSELMEEHIALKKNFGEN